jgi:hypothetical protein
MVKSRVRIFLHVPRVITFYLPRLHPTPPPVSIEIHSILFLSFILHQAIDHYGKQQKLEPHYAASIYFDMDVKVHNDGFCPSRHSLFLAS